MAERAPSTPLQRLVEGRIFQRLTLAAILVNAVVIGVDVHHDLPPDIDRICAWLDRGFLVFFSAEIGLRWWAWRGQFLRDRWNVFDVLVVAPSAALAVLGVSESGPWSILRTLRVLRITRAVRLSRPMRQVVEALFHAIPRITAIVGVLFVFFYIAAVFTTDQFGRAHPDRFGNLFVSWRTLFQLTLFDDWGNIVSQIREHWWATLGFMAFTIVSAFAVLNLFIAVMVDTLREGVDRQQRQELGRLEEGQASARRELDEVEKALHGLREEQGRLRAEIARMAKALDALASQRRPGARDEDGRER